MIVLGIETSCDETSAAVVRDGRILANAVSSQADLHAVYGGVVPEVASRQHLKILDSIIGQAWQSAGVVPQAMDAVAVTRGPGLPSALLVGVAAARGLALRLQKPIFPIHHIEAHLYSPTVDVSPFVALVVSGGHTLLAHVPDFGGHRVLGQTLDDAAGEAFDKAAQLMGLGYPGGPEIEREGAKGNPRAFDFPRPMIHSEDWSFSFSGLKTALRRAVVSLRGMDPGARPSAVTSASPLSVRQIADLCASFQAAVVEVLLEKTVRAAKTHRVLQIAVSGGVACNSRLREAFEARCKTEGIRLAWADRKLCTDNAAMIALLAERKAQRGFVPPSDWDIQPDWTLEKSRSSSC